jgi:uridine kinase
MPQHATRAEAVARAVEAAAGSQRTAFIGIDGRGGAGKTTLATLIAAEVPGAAVVHADDFSGPHVAEWDWPRLQRQVVDPLLAGRAARYQRWDWHDDEPGEWDDVAPGGLVIIEGVSSTRAELVVPWRLQIWVDAPRQVRLARAVERDGPGMLRQWTDVWMPLEEAYVARERPQERVDLVVSGIE